MKKIQLNNRITLKIFEDLDNLNSSLSSVLQNALKKGLCVLPGGETPKKLFKTISIKEKAKVLLSDDRLVPLSNEKSNFSSLINSLDTKFKHGYPISYYNYLKSNDLESLNKFLKELISKNKIKLSLLGLGTDSHYASIFPFNKKKNHDLGFVIKNKNESFSRFSLNTDTILSSEKIIFLVLGKHKLNAMKNIFLKKYNNQEFPAQEILYNHNDIIFYCDKESSDFLEKCGVLNF